MFSIGVFPWFSQALVPNALYSILFLVDKDGSAKLDRDFGVQVKMTSNSFTYLYVWKISGCFSFIFSLHDLMSEISCVQKLTCRHLNLLFLRGETSSMVLTQTFSFFFPPWHRLRRFHPWRHCWGTSTKPSWHETWRAPIITTTTTGSASDKCVWRRHLFCCQNRKYIC